MIPALGPALSLALALCASAACAGNEPAPAAPVVEPAIDVHRAENDAKGLVAEIYQTISRGQTDSLYSLLSDAMIVFGPRKLDASASRANALLLLGKVVDPKAKKHAQLRSTGLSITPSPGGHSARMFDVVYADNQPLAVSAVLTNTGDIWSVSAAMIAEISNGHTIKAESAKDAVVPPGSAAAAKVDPAAADAVEQFKRGIADPASWGDELASRSDAMIIGPASGEITHGADAIKRMWKARLKSNVREATSGEFTAARSPDGQLAWLSVAVTRVADDAPDPLPLRIFAIYEKDGAGWKLAMLHEAVALDEPGAGVPFKKIVPGPASAAPAAPAAPPTPAAPPASGTPPAPGTPPAEPVKVEVTAKVDVTDAKPEDAAAAKPKTKAKAKKAKTRKPKPKPKSKSKPKPAADPASGDSNQGATAPPAAQ
ncbi:MAG TPA: nuclear transport factor 2 family protein [Kofleriaceae bacterium]|nr:nuclear transport factor 2 family protein [Kofleriaceae bacterium]